MLEYLQYECSVIDVRHKWFASDLSRIQPQIDLSHCRCESLKTRYDPTEHFSLSVHILQHVEVSGWKNQEIYKNGANHKLI